MSSLPPIPGPPFLLDHLSGYVFLLHIVFMNFVVAAPFVIAWQLLVRGEEGRQRAQWLAAALPVAFTFAINFGVAPLLFVQAIYTKYFYTANLILGTKWLAVIAYLLIAFYGSYLLKHLLVKKTHVWLPGLLASAVGLIVWLIGFTMTANYFVSTSESQWQAMLERPWLFLENPTFLPRAFHFLVGSFTITGLWIVWISWWRQRKQGLLDDLLKFRQQGLLLASSATALQIVIGIWFLFRLPSEAMDKLFSASFDSLVWMSAVAAGLVLLGFLIVATLFPQRALWQKISSALLIYTLFGMIAGRDLIRVTALGPDFKLRDLPSVSQGSPMTIFFVLLLLGVATIAFLLWLVWRLPKSSQ
jgi:cytochrome bd-type quinol oxidase subunit 1